LFKAHTVTAWGQLVPCEGQGSVTCLTAHRVVTHQQIDLPRKTEDVTRLTYPPPAIRCELGEATHRGNEKGSTPGHGLKCDKGCILVPQRRKHDETS
jgi:hypothetical protein